MNSLLITRVVERKWNCRLLKLVEKWMKNRRRFLANFFASLVSISYIDRTLNYAILFLNIYKQLLTIYRQWTFQGEKCYLSIKQINNNYQRIPTFLGL